MKRLHKVYAALICALIMTGIFTVDVWAEGTGKKLKVAGRCAIAMEKESKKVLFEQNGYEVVEMASTTKILTALVTLENSDINSKFTVSKKAASCRGSKVNYKALEEISVKELLYGLMYRSGNDAAITLAEGISGSEEEFSKLMNHYAHSLGLVDSMFKTPHGLDKEDHYSSAYDLALLTAKAMDYPLFREIVGSKQYLKSESGFTRDYININKILWKIPGANGVKTGFTGKAGKCLVSSVKNKKGKDIIIVVLNCPNRWDETKKIYDSLEDEFAFNSMTQDKFREEEKNILSNIAENEEVTFAYNDKKTKGDIDVFIPELHINGGDAIAAYKVIKEDKSSLEYYLKNDINTFKEIAIE